MYREHKKGCPFLCIGNIKTGFEVGRRNNSKVGVVVLMLADSRAISLTVCLYRSPLISTHVCRTSSSPAPWLLIRRQRLSNPLFRNVVGTSCLIDSAEPVRNTKCTTVCNAWGVGILFGDKLHFELDTLAALSFILSMNASAFTMLVASGIS